MSTSSTNVRTDVSVTAENDSSSGNSTTIAFGVIFLLAFIGLVAGMLYKVGAWSYVHNPANVGFRAMFWIAVVCFVLAIILLPVGAQG